MFDFSAIILTGYIGIIALLVVLIVVDYVHDRRNPNKHEEPEQGMAALLEAEGREDVQREQMATMLWQARHHALYEDARFAAGAACIFCFFGAAIAAIPELSTNFFVYPACGVLTVRSVCEVLIPCITVMVLPFAFYLALSFLIERVRSRGIERIQMELRIREEQ